MIRLAKQEDLAQINELGSRYNSNFSRLFDLEAIILNKDYKIFVSESCSHEIEGFLITFDTYEVSNIILIIVKDMYRHQHIGSVLLDYYISNLSLDIEKIMLEVNVTNQIAINFYQKFGFKIIHVRKNYYSDNNDAYIMERSIESE